MVKGHWTATALHMQARGVCDFSPPLGNVDAGINPSDTGLPVVGSVQLEFGNTEITASEAITVDSTSIIYVGYTNSSGNFVGAVRISTVYYNIYKIHEMVLVSKSSSTSLLLHHFHLSLVRRIHFTQEILHLL